MRPNILLAASVLLALAAAPAAAAPSGEQLFRQDCSICHDTTPGKNKLGPSLAGVYGRVAGKVAGFDYSSAMANAGLTWNDKTLDEFLADPSAAVPGNKMPFLGVRNPAERQAIIAYLKTLKP